MNKPRPLRKPSPPPAPRVLSAAECARRTGVTVRTLRVYEREGLLTPQRSANGYRVYGEGDIGRLNCILTLKTLGLTLREIRGVLSTVPPPLTEVLQLRRKAWIARQTEAEQTLLLLRAALARLTEGAALSIEELCELAKSTETTQSAQARAFRALVNEAITPEEERAYQSWWAAHPEHAKSMQAFREAQEPMLQKLAALHQCADPAAAEVQQIVEHHQQLMTVHGVREQLLELMQWNPVIARKYLALGERLRDQTTKANNSKFFAFFAAARRASPAGRAFAPILEEAGALVRQGTACTSSKALQLARRLTRLCRRFKLGCPVAFALSAAFMARTERGGEWLELDAEQQAPLRFLAEAARAAEHD